MARIVIKFPTRNRPEKFQRVFSKYISYLSGKQDVSFVVTMDLDDPSMNNEQMWHFFEEMKKSVPISYHYGSSKTKIEAVNANMEGVDGDILVVASDDMIPCFEGYDDIIANGFDQFFPDFNGAIKFHDGLRRPNDLLMTLPVIGFPVIREWGYIYHPDYTSVYADNEQTLVLHKTNRLIVSSMCIIRHEWTPEPFDELHARNENRDMYIRDGKVYNERLARNFDLG